MSVAFSQKVRDGESTVTVAAGKSRSWVRAARSGTIACRSFGSITLRPPNSSRTSLRKHPERTAGHEARPAIRRVRRRGVR